METYSLSVRHHSTNLRIVRATGACDRVVPRNGENALEVGKQGFLQGLLRVSRIETIHLIEHNKLDPGPFVPSGIVCNVHVQKVKSCRFLSYQ